MGLFLDASVLRFGSSEAIGFGFRCDVTLLLNRGCSDGVVDCVLFRRSHTPGRWVLSMRCTFVARRRILLASRLFVTRWSARDIGESESEWWLYESRQ